MSCCICPRSNSRICRDDEHCGLCWAESIEEVQQVLDRVFTEQEEVRHEPES